MIEIGPCDVHGIVERFGRYVLGAEGWRAEWVVIRELVAPDTETALAVMRKYPDVRVHVKEQEACNELTPPGAIGACCSIAGRYRHHRANACPNRRLNGLAR